MRRVVIGIFALVVLVIVFIALCTFVRRPYEIVLLNRFGNVIVCSDATAAEHPAMMYHWYFKLPTDQPVRIDTRLHLEQTPLQQVVTHGAEPISIRTFVAWRIVDPEKFYRTTAGSDDTARGIIERKVSGLVQAKVAAYMLDELFNTDEKKVHMADMEKDIAREATVGSEEPKEDPKADPAHPRKKASGVNEQGLEIVQVGFSRMAFPPGNASAVYERMAAERDKQAADFESQGKALNDQITKAGLAEAAQIRGRAKEKAGQIMGEGDQMASEILAGVQQSKEAADFYQYWKSLEFVKGAFTKNTIIVQPTDSAWLKPLFGAPQKMGDFPPMTQPGKSSAAGPLPSIEKLAQPVDLGGK